MTFVEFRRMLSRRPRAKVAVLSTADREELIDEIERLNLHSGFVFDRSRAVSINGVLVKDEADS